VFIFVSRLWEQLPYERANSCGDSKHAEEQEVGSQQEIDPVLREKFEEQIETEENAAADYREHVGIVR